MRTSRHPVQVLGSTHPDTLCKFFEAGEEGTERRTASARRHAFYGSAVGHIIPQARLLSTHSRAAFGF